MLRRMEGKRLVKVRRSVLLTEDGSTEHTVERSA